MTNLSNSAPVIAEFDKAIRQFGLADGAVENARIDFLGKLGPAYANGSLGFKVKPMKNGDVPEAVEGDYAQHALEIYTAARTEKLGRVVPLHAPMKTVWTDVIKASRADVTIVQRALALVKELTDESNARVAEAKAAAVAAGEKFSASDVKTFNVKTYDAIVKVTKAQAKAFADAERKEQGLPPRMSDDELRALFDAAPKKKTEAQELAAVVKALDKMAKTFPAHAGQYGAAAVDLGATLANLKTADAATAKRDDFIAYMVEKGYSMEQAISIADAPRQNAPDGGRVLKEAA